MKFWQYLDPRRIPSHINPDNLLAVLQERMLQTILLFFAGMGSIVAPFALINAISNNLVPLSIMIVVGYSLLVFSFVRRDLVVRLRSSLILLALLAIGFSSLAQRGLSGTGPLFVLGATILMAMLLHGRFGTFGIALTILGMALVGLLAIGGVIAQPSPEVLASSTTLGSWITAIMVLTSLAVISATGFSTIYNGIKSSLDQAHQLAREIQSERDALEVRVAARTYDIQARNNQIELASQIANNIATISDPDELLRRSVELIKTQFNYYHTSIFLVDDNKEFAVLRAAPGEAGQQLMARGHKLRIGETGIVGYAAGKGMPRITPNVHEDPNYYSNPVLPLTQSEMAVPLKIGEDIIGVLDVQSDQLHAFSNEDIKIIQTIANQLSIAIQNSRLVFRLQATVQEMEQGYRQFTQKAWRPYLRSAKRRFAYRIHQSRMETDAPAGPNVEKVLTDGKPVQATGTGSTKSTLSLPILLRGEILGVLEVGFLNESVPQDVQPLLQTAASRLALALDSARLLEEVQNRADREHMVGNISAKVRTFTDIDGILRSAATELGRTMGVSQVTVQLRESEEEE